MPSLMTTLLRWHTHSAWSILPFGQSTEGFAFKDIHLTLFDFALENH